MAQEVFAQLWSRPYAFGAGRGTLRTWLTVLAHRRAVDRVRGEARHRENAGADDSTLRAIPDTGPGPGETVVDRERSLLLNTALAELPQPRREVSGRPARPRARKGRMMARGVPAGRGTGTGNGRGSQGGGAR